MELTAIKQPRHQDVWQGIYRGLSYKIVHWGVDESFTPGGNGNWNYYVFLPEHKVKDFAAIWLEDKVYKSKPEVRGYITHDYFNNPATNVDWHGGATYYAKHGHTEGYRCVEVGCDYAHLWDYERERGYTLSEVLTDVQHTIDELQPLLLEESVE